MSLYPKLAWQSIRGNRKFYLPYAFALMGNVAAFYIMGALATDAGMADMVPGRPNAMMYVEVFMVIGRAIAGLFSFIFLLYINSFLMKRRKKELGLYNILGMGKIHIALVLLYETLFLGLLGIGGGLLVGMLFHRLVTLTLYKVLDFPVPFGIMPSVQSIVMTAIFFAVLLGLTLLFNLNRVRVSKPIELLRSGNVGEREPKTRWILTILGVATLGAGYYIAVTTADAVSALSYYFVAVILVIIGTYCLFTAVSIAVLKLLRKNKRFYYRTSHFIGVSGMLYRMKQNAVGLANICILCTMVMVMISGTVSLYLGSDKIVREQYPSDIRFSMVHTLDPVEDEPLFDRALFYRQMKDFLAGEGETVNDAWDVETLEFSVMRQADGTLESMRRYENGGMFPGEHFDLTCLTAADYATLTGETVELAEDEVLLYGLEGDTVTIRWYGMADWQEQGTSSFRVAGRLEENPRYSPNIAQLATMVVADEDVLNDLFRRQEAAYGDNSSLLHWYGYFDLENNDPEHLDQLEDTFWDAWSAYINGEGGYSFTGVGSRTPGWQDTAGGRADVYGLAGGFLFLGIFLGLVFLMATVLMIYYKQLSEGYEDKERFEIMQQVGLTPEEVKKSIHSQILMVFFLPIAVAAIHIVFDFHLVELLLTLFYMHDRSLVLRCTAGTVGLFFLVYGAVYLITARTYYKIVERKIA